MEHLDEDRLVVVALHAEPVDAETESHLETCEVCRAELEEMLRVVSAARLEYDESTDLIAPPKHVWSAVAAAVSGDETVVPLVPARRPAERSVQGPWGPRVPTWLAVAAGVVIGAAGVGAAAWVSGWGEPS
jgi:anti-sigma factor RsiW